LYRLQCAYFFQNIQKMYLSCRDHCMVDREVFCILIWQPPSRMDPHSTDLRIMISWQFLMGQDMLVIHEHLVLYPANCHNRSVYCSNLCSPVVFYHSVWTVVVFVYLDCSYTQRFLWNSVMRVELTSHYKYKLCILMFAFFLFVSTTTTKWSNVLFVILINEHFDLKCYVNNCAPRKIEDTKKINSKSLYIFEVLWSRFIICLP